MQKLQEPPGINCKMKMNPDRISNLPDNIIEGILSHLPISDAVRTSLLSSKWRYKWATVPYLVFDDRFYLFSSRNKAAINSKIVSIVDRVLLLHLGPIQKFELSHREFLAVSDIDRWILHLSRSSIESIVLEICKGEAYRMPSCLFSCQSLTNLELRKCSLKPPSGFKGFRKLKKLDLQYVTFDQDVFENLISSCPDLERLYLRDIVGLSRIKVNVPKLQVFIFEGSIEDISFENTFNLAEVVFSYYENVKNTQSQALDNSSNLLKFFVNLSNIEMLRLNDYSLKYLAVGIGPHKLPQPCIKLHNLTMYINLNNFEESITSLSLLSSTPNLEEIEITVCPDEQAVDGIDTNFWQDGCWNCSFDKLRFVRITGIAGAKPELDFMKFLISNSPVLERMEVTPASTSVRWELVTKLLSFRRASNRAEIIYMDP